MTPLSGWTKGSSLSQIDATSATDADATYVPYGTYRADNSHDLMITNGAKVWTNYLKYGTLSSNDKGLFCNIKSELARKIIKNKIVLSRQPFCPSTVKLQDGLTEISRDGTVLTGGDAVLGKLEEILPLKREADDAFR